MPLRRIKKTFSSTPFSIASDKMLVFILHNILHNILHAADIVFKSVKINNLRYCFS